MMQPPWDTSTMGRLAYSGAVHLMYRSRSWPPRKKPVSLRAQQAQVSREPRLLSVEIRGECGAASPCC